MMYLESISFKRIRHRINRDDRWRAYDEGEI
jgi:hypothetical protein